METRQDQVVIYVVLHVLYQYVLEQTTVCVQDVVGPVAHIPAALAHGPCVAILQLRLLPWEEVTAHVLQVLLLQGRCNPLIPLLAIWCGQVGVEITKHQQCAPRGPLLMAVTTSSTVEASSRAK